MKDKTTAGILALFLGWLGIHRFYLNQTALGLLYLFTGGFCLVLPILDAIIFLTMDPDQFDRKYNPMRKAQEVHVHVHQPQTATTPQVQQAVKQAVKEVRRAPSPIQERRRTTPPKTKRIPDNPHKITGISKFKQYDFKGAKDSFKKALSIHYDDIATHFNLGCCYSMEEDIDKALFHLSKAVELGFTDFKRIDNHDALAFLRSEDEFLEFAANKYQWKTVEETKEDKAEPKKLDAPAADVLAVEDEPIEILDLNAPVKERVILTEELSKEKEGEISYQDTRDIFDDIFGTDDDFSPPNPIQPIESTTSGLSGDMMEKLKQLGDLRDKGILTEEEFNEQKKRLLS